MAAYTTATFLSSVERQSFSPANQATFSTSDILALGDEILLSTVIPELVGVREEYYVTYKDYMITANQAAYTLPQRSMGMAAREVHIVDINGNVRNLPRISVDSLNLRSHSSSTPDAFYLRGDSLVLSPTPASTTGTLRVYYSLAPGSLVETTACAVISAINTSTNVISVATIPSTWVTGNSFDLIQSTGSHAALSIDNVSTTVSGTDITLPSLPTGLAVGDYVCLAGESCLIQLPNDVRPMLATLVAAEMLISMNQPSGEKLLAKGMTRLMQSLKLITPRVSGEAEVIIPDWY